MSGNLVSGALDDLVLSHADQSLKCTTFVLDCSNQLTPLANNLGINRINFSSSDAAKADSGRFLYPPTSGPVASRSLSWCLTSTDSCGILNLSGVPNLTDTHGGNEDSELWKKRAKTRVGCKRKASESLSAISQVPTKIFINEKQISSCLGRLSLDNNNLDSHPDLEEEPWFQMEVVPRRSQSELNFSSLLERVNTNQNSKLVLYRGLQLGLRRRSVLPSLVQDEIKKPLMQVVLWKPPEGAINSIFGQHSFNFGRQAATAAQCVFNTPVHLPNTVEAISCTLQINTAVESGTIMKDGQNMDTEDL